MWWYFLLCYPWTGKQSDSLSEIESVAKACNQFSFDLHHQLQSSENVFFSPYSICAAFAMVLLGADGNTAKQIGTTFHYKESLDVHKAFNKLSSEYEQQNIEKYTLKTANRLFLSNDFEVKPTYQKMLQSYYAATLQQLVFGTGKAEVTINKWIEKQTNDLIKDFFPIGSLKEATTFVLVNAVYFKGFWQKTFGKEETREAIFYSLNGSEVVVNMMRQTEEFAYLNDADLNAKILKMPYSGKRLSMLIILPNELFGLPAVMRKLTAKKVMKLMDSGKKVDVYVKFPKFKLESEINLKKILCEMNLTEIFSERSNLSWITEKPLFISDVKHKAYIQVNEEGTEAAAAVTVVGGFLMYDLSSSEEKYFICDHPFYFAIFDNTNKFILFSGIIVEPESV